MSNEYRVQIVNVDGTIRNWDGDYSKDWAILEMDELAGNPWDSLTYKEDIEVRVFAMSNRSIVDIRKVNW